MDLVGLFLLLFAVVLFTAVTAWRHRSPGDTRENDPPGVRSIVAFHGDDPSLFTDDEPEELLAGVRLFDVIRDALESEGATIEARDRLQCAERLVLLLDEDRFAIVLEHIDPDWVLSVEWAPSNDRERQYQEREFAVFAPKDGPPLRRLLTAVDQVIREHPLLSEVLWLPRQDWVESEWENGKELPFDEGTPYFSPDEEE